VKIIARRNISGSRDDGQQSRQGEDQSMHCYDVLWHLLILEFAVKKY